MTNPLHSMTGYASVQADYHSPEQQQWQIEIELRSVNSRYLDLHFRLSDEIRDIETELRALITQQLQRGKVEIRITLRTVNHRHATFDPQQLFEPQQAAELAALEAHILKLAPHAQPLTVADWMTRLRPTTHAHAAANTPLDKGLKQALMQHFKAALEQLIAARTTEGTALHTVLREVLATGRSAVQDLQAQLPALQQAQFTALCQRAQALCQALHTQAPEDLETRLRADLVQQLIHDDVAEELARLTIHFDQFEQMLNSGGAIGKKADFLMQELNREANTLGAKAARIEITDTSLALKLTVDRLREQIQNVQ